MNTPFELHHCFNCIRLIILYGRKVLTIIQRRNHAVCSWPISPNVTSGDGAVVRGGWCEPSQCEGACCCVLHGNTVPCTSLRGTGEEVASDHPITEGGGRRRPRECHVPCCMLNDLETQWWTCWGWEGQEESRLFEPVLY